MSCGSAQISKQSRQRSLYNVVFGLWHKDVPRLDGAFVSVLCEDVICFSVCKKNVKLLDHLITCVCREGTCTMSDTLAV